MTFHIPRLVQAHVAAILFVILVSTPLKAQRGELAPTPAKNAHDGHPTVSRERAGTIPWQNIRGQETYRKAVTLYRKGKFSKAAAFYQKACDASNSNACTDLGFMYSRGEGVKQDYPRAIKLYNRGCEGGTASACTNLGIFYYSGSYDRTVEFFRRACDGGDGPGCFGLGFMYERGLAVPKSETRAAELYKKACDAGSSLGCTSLRAFGELRGP